ncbi:hypothetical protein [Mesorhizobium sp. M0203]|uniref:hypothetical protein n=1 Tax=Mesorhizobium sp. M0203 TaxID=2956912 RepID=UPI003334DDB9
MTSRASISIQTPSQETRPAAEAKDVPASAAFPHFTESCLATANPRQDLTAPAFPAKTPGAVTLSEASAFILSLIAAHEGRSERDIVAELIAAAGDAIGLSPLLKRDADDIDDLVDVPPYARSAANRFRGGGP